MTTGDDGAIVGKVEAANERGVKLENATGWKNYSRYANDGALDRTIKVGDTIAIWPDSDGYIAESELRHRPEPTPAQVATEAVDRDTRIMRQALLNTAVSIMALPFVTDMAQHIALELERWVLRTESAVEEELIDLDAELGPMEGGD